MSPEPGDLQIQISELLEKSRRLREEASQVEKAAEELRRRVQENQPHSEADRAMVMGSLMGEEPTRSTHPSSEREVELLDGRAAGAGSISSK